MTQFDWQTDEDDWVEPQEGKLGASRQLEPQKRKRLLLVGGATIIIVLVGLGLLFALVRHRAEIATNEVTMNLYAAHTLLQESTISNDEELFSLALYPQNEWRETQQELLVRQLFWNRSALGLWLDLATFDPKDTEQIEVTYAPDLRSAEVTAVLPYITHGDDDRFVSLSLRKTAVYRQVDAGWHYAPFPTGFWGDEVVLNGRYFSIQTPQRDSDISKQLLQDIDDLIVDACAIPELECPEKLQVELQLQTDPESSFELNQNYQVSTVYRAASGRVLQVKMPAPTLVGLPVDDVGYEALLKGYAAQVIASIMSNIDSNCCSFGPNAPSVFALQLQEIGLKPPMPAGYHPQSQLIETPLSLPDQDILALCQVGSVGTVLRYDLQTTVWTEEYIPNNGFVSQMLAAGGDGVLLTTFPSITDSMSRLELLVDGQPTLIDVSTDWINLASVFPDWVEGSDALIVTYQKVDGELWEDRLIKIDPHSCDSESGCSIEALSSYPIFSPEKTHSMVRIVNEVVDLGVVEFWLGDAAGEPSEKLGDLLGPAWQDEQTILFTKRTKEYPYETALMRLRGENGFYQYDARETLVSDEALDRFLGADQDGVDYLIAGILSASGQLDDIVEIFALKMTGDDAFMTGYLLQFDTLSGELGLDSVFCRC